MALNSQLKRCQISTNDDQKLIFCLSYSITTVFDFKHFNEMKGDSDEMNIKRKITF